MAGEPNPRINRAAIEARLRQLWNGDVPLKETFWVYYFAVVLCFAVLSTVGGFLGFLFTLAGMAWGLFMIKPILMAAERYQGNVNYALLAKVAAVLILLCILGILAGGI
jgi:hypothetical protein